MELAVTVVAAPELPAGKVAMKRVQRLCGSGLEGVHGHCVPAVLVAVGLTSGNVAAEQHAATK